MREILTSGSRRGEEVGLPPRFPSYSTPLCTRPKLVSALTLMAQT